MKEIDKLKKELENNIIENKKLGKLIGGPMHRERYIENILLSDPNSLIKFEEKIDKEASIFSSKKKLDDELIDKYIIKHRNED